MIKPVSPSQCEDYLRQFFTPAAATALSAELFREEEETGENFFLSASICSSWEEFPSFQSAQDSVLLAKNEPAWLSGGAQAPVKLYSPEGITFPGGFLHKK